MSLNVSSLFICSSASLFINHAPFYLSVFICLSIIFPLGGKSKEIKLHGAVLTVVSSDKYLKQNANPLLCYIPVPEWAHYRSPRHASCSPLYTVPGSVFSLRAQYAAVQYSAVPPLPAIVVLRPRRPPTLSSCSTGHRMFLTRAYTKNGRSQRISACLNVNLPLVVIIPLHIHGNCSVPPLPP